MKITSKTICDINNSRFVSYSLDDEKVCAKSISILILGDKIKDVIIEGGCQGNGIGISTLLEGMPINTVINKLSGIDCHNKGTSCPDMIARILKEIINNDQD